MDDDVDDDALPDISFADGSIGAKKRKKLEAKAEKRAQRQVGKNCGSLFWTHFIWLFRLNLPSVRKRKTEKPAWKKSGRNRKHAKRWPKKNGHVY